MRGLESVQGIPTAAEPEPTAQAAAACQTAAARTRAANDAVEAGRRDAAELPELLDDLRVARLPVSPKPPPPPLPACELVGVVREGAAGRTWTVPCWTLAHSSGMAARGRRRGGGGGRGGAWGEEVAEARGGKW